MKLAFNISPCVLCGSTDYARAPFTRVQIRNDGYQAVFICKVCGMTPFFASRKDEHQQFTEQHYYESGAYTVYQESLLARVDDCISRLNHHGYLKHKTLLDVGCGEGYLLEKAQAAGAIVTGIEPNKSVCKRLQEKGLRVLQGFAEDYPVGEQFDVITLFWVLDATHDPIAVLKRMRSLLKTEGLLLVQLGSVFNAPLIIQRPMDLFIKTQNSATDYHPYYFTRKSVKASLERVGFEIVEEPKKYSTTNFFVAKPSQPKDLSEIDLQGWRSLRLFFILWRVRDWVLINQATKPLYARLDLPNWKRRIKNWLPK